MQRFRAMALAVTFLASICPTAMAQTSAPAASASDSQLLKPEELDQLVAPIALYPDPLLAEVLMASTYPIDVVNAERWLKNNKNLSGDQLRAATDKQSWDQSVKALVATPSVLGLMSSKLDWTQKLGDAVLAQQTDVMDAVQRLRARAQENNKLNSTNEQTVRVEQVQNRQIIAIEPTQPGTIYVPYYDPGVVYGSWPYPAYPPYYWPAPGYIGAGLIAGGIAFGAGYALGRWGAGGWGGGFNWTNNNININRSISGAGTNWQRGSGNRQGLGNRGGRQQGVNFGNRGGNLGNRGGVGNRGNLGNRGGAGNRGNLGNRGGAGRGGHVAHRGGGGGMHAMRGGGGRGGGFRGGGGRGGGGRGGRRSDIVLKHDIIFLGRLDNGLGLYRFSYNGSNRAYVGVIAQEVQRVMPQAVERGRDGYLRVQYEKLGLKFESYDRWVGAGAQVPYAVRIQH